MTGKISVIMGIHNEAQTLETAVDSIVNQTYSNWEFIICDDASTDESYKILLKYKKLYPEKFILLRNIKNKKLAYSLNLCLKKATGKYIARMDADDISRTDRFEKQITYLRDNPDVDLVGSSVQRFDENGYGEIVSIIEYPDRYALKSGTVFNHPTIMTYKKIYDELEGYKVSKITERGQDLELWFRFFEKKFRGYNIQEPLVYFRENKDAIKRRTIKTRLNSLQIRLNGFKRLDYPLYWYPKPIIITVVKSMIPYTLIIMYRRFQKYIYRK